MSNLGHAGLVTTAATVFVASCLSVVTIAISIVVNRIIVMPETG